MATATDLPDNFLLDQAKIRADFPILQQEIHRRKPLVYFDNGASTQHPRSVIDAMTQAYEQTYANVHRGIHWLSEQSTAQFEDARSGIAKFIHAANDREVIFTQGTTTAINLVARAWGDSQLKRSDEILLTEMEHHSNIVPWQQLAERSGARVRFVPIDSEGRLDLNQVKTMLSVRPKIFAFTAISNVLGTINPVRELAKMARQQGVVTLVDAAQHVPHEPIDVQEWEADFVAFSGHKMLGPSGIGILHGRMELLEKMPPFLGGGNMIERVGMDGFTPGEVPARFEAGTPPIVEAIGLHAAIQYLSAIGMDRIQRHEQTLMQHMQKKLESQIDGLRVLGPRTNRAAIFSFVVEGINPQDLAKMLDFQGIAIRAGHHCAMPLHDKLGIRSSSRASLYLYNSTNEIDFFVEALRTVIGKLR